MRLRNKKTGEVIESEYMMLVQITSTKGERNLLLEDLAELNNEWEDYEPIEPRIEDPKACKIFRAWADLYGAKQFRVSHHDNFGEGKTTSIWSTDIPTEPGIELPGHIGKDSETYTITELCGEEA